jgi:hypothetical protein
VGAHVVVVVVVITVVIVVNAIRRLTPICSPRRHAFVNCSGG